MKQPDTTYRLQLSPQFTFNDLERILDYLDDLGISTIYSAPFFQSRKGSTHGYDVLDPFNINKEIGDLKQFSQIGERLSQKGMTWLQDIVPNHMAYDSGNPWIRDIFELGPQSRFYNFFDIDWEYNGLKKVMAPFLGNNLEEVLNQEEILLKYEEAGLCFSYYENSYPASIRTYEEIFSLAGADEWLKRFKAFSESIEEWQELKVSFLKELDENEEFRDIIKDQINEINKSTEKLKNILELQFFTLTHWQHTEKEINYRRFFTINGLICLRMEDPKVFETYHHFIKEVCEAGLVNGLRIDHIDGLFDPEGYLINLREIVGPDFYIIVEKILEADEKLPNQWAVQGTSGYDFLAQVNHLFTRSSSQDIFTEFYEKISPRIPDYESLVFQKKLFILKERMGGELENLYNLLKESGLTIGNAPEDSWREAISGFLAAFPVYRVYPQDFPLKPRQLQIIEKAYQRAKSELPDFEAELDHLKRVYLGEAEKDTGKMLFFLQRCQQFSGPLAAKGVEDTSFYIYNRLIAHNEVGDSPENFGITIKDFHEKMLQRRKNFPESVNATATHDTKRGEDARMRLDVLSEIPQEWFEKIEDWKKINRSVRKDPNVPDNNEEYFIYQTLIGGMPFREEEDFISRTCDYLQKVLREAKVHSNWANPDEEYERKVFQFIEEILVNQEFLDSFKPFVKKISGLGAIKSLGQSLIKITAPGVPDVYQGTELWDLSYVDPDNRRPVDYGLRSNYLADFRAFSKTNLKKKLSSLKRNYSSGKIKMFVLYKTLLQRRKEQDFFKKGDYLPLTISGKAGENFIAFARVFGEEWRIIVAPVLVAGLFNTEDLKPLNGHLDDIFIKLPGNAPAEWDNLFTGETEFVDGKLPLSKAVANFPVVFLKNRKQTWN